MPLANLIKCLPPGSTCLDVGANIGLTTIATAVGNPNIRVIAFEPVPSNAALLAQNIQTNGIENCTIVNTAVGDHVGRVSINDNGPWSIVGGGSVEVPMTTLDTYCAEQLPGTRIDFIKIDVEGYEPNVLAGAAQILAQWRPIIFMEFNAWTLALLGHSPVAVATRIWSAFDVQSHDRDSVIGPNHFCAR